MTFKKLIVSTLTLSAILFSFASCGGTDSKEDDGSKTAKVNGKISISGSTSVAPVLKSLAEAFQEINSDVEIDIQENGSSQGIKDATDQKVDLGSSSRELKESEKGLKEIVIAYDGIAAITNKDVKVNNLTKAQLADIYSGKITNWKQVGGSDAAIVVVGRDAASGTRGAFEEILKLTGKDGNPAPKYAQELDSTGAVKTTVQTTKNAIGYVSLEAVDDTVTAISLDGVKPSIETVKDKTYILQRPFLLVYSEAKGLSTQTQAFVDFILGTDGQNIVKNDKLITVS